LATDPNNYQAWVADATSNIQALRWLRV
jgi:hypothetical protein